MFEKTKCKEMRDDWVEDCYKWFTRYAAYYLKYIVLMHELISFHLDYSMEGMVELKKDLDDFEQNQKTFVNMGNVDTYLFINNT